MGEALAHRILILAHRRTSQIALDSWVTYCHPRLGD